MKPKPRHLGPEYAGQFRDRSVVEAYEHRPPYPSETFKILSGLIADEPKVVLDVGCGTGYIARNLVHLVDWIDAVDFSRPMLEKARGLPRGNHPNINWICSRVEEIPLHSHYGLITAGSSLHWMEWEVVFPRFREILDPRGYLSILTNLVRPAPWNAELKEIIQFYSTNQDFEPYDLVQELQSRGLFEKHGEEQTAPMPFRQCIHDYVESFHSMNGFSRERMGREEARAFDTEVKELVRGFCRGEDVEMQITGKIVWGKPINPL